MLFVEFRFLFFFAAVLLVHWGLRWNTARKIWLLITSYGFYACWDWRFLGLILFSTLVDWFAGAGIHRNEGRRKVQRAWLTLSLTSNLGLLCTFKYFDFFTSSAQEVLGWLGVGTSLPVLNLVLPVGISFYTFQTLSYTIDIYFGKLKPTRSLLNLALFVGFFPQLVAGPIVRARTFLPQLEHRAPLSSLRLRYGAYRCIEGLFLKVVVADGLAPAVQRSFDVQATVLSPTGAWYSAILFGGQIFADFAGYTGIAIGVACLLGLRFPENFRAPYLSTSLSEFWARWHISLSSWLRDYFYVSLGGNRHSQLRTFANLMIVMVLGGLWHGASWSFVIWGALHGSALIFARLAARRMRGPLTGIRRFGAGIVVFAFVHVAWVYFRAQDLGTAQAMVHTMLVEPFIALSGGAEELGTRSPSARYAVLLLPIFIIHAAQWAHERLALPRSETLRAVAAGLMLFGLTVFRRGEAYQFIYFQF